MIVMLRKGCILNSSESAAIATGRKQEEYDNEYERYNQFVGERNDATSYADMISDLKCAMDAVTNNLDVGEINTWYMEILEIVSSPIVGMAVRRRNN